MRTENLTTIKGGLNRERTKGAALKDSLYDLLNAHVTSRKTVRARPGTTLKVTLPAGTVGLRHHASEFQVFASSSVANIPAGYNLNIVRAPDGAALSKIHFAEPFLGALYVVAEFADGDIYHYWLQSADAWTANTEYKLSDAVEPTVPNAFTYTPKRAGPPYPTWNAGTPRTVGDKVEPTVYNGYYFEVISVVGTNPRSGSDEPDWQNAVAGQVFNENVDGAIIPTTPTPVTPPDRRPGLTSELDDRYGDGRATRNETRWSRP